MKRLLPLACLILFTACSETPVRPTGCQVDLGLLQDLSFPERPNGAVTNGWMIESLKDLRLRIDSDNANKKQLRKQIEVCNR